MSKLEELKPNAAARGILPDGLATVVSVQWFGSEALGAVLARIADRFNAIEVVNVPELVERVLRKNGFLTHYRHGGNDRSEHGRHMRLPAEVGGATREHFLNRMRRQDEQSSNRASI